MNRQEVLEIRKKIKSIWTYHLKAVLEWEKYSDTTDTMKLVNVMRRYVARMPDDMTMEEKVRQAFSILVEKLKTYKKNFNCKKNKNN